MNNYAALTPPEEVVESVRRKAGQTIEEILSKESELDMYARLGAIEVLVGSKIYKGLEISPAERMVFGLTWLAREVGTGGFRQFFINSAGDFWKDVLSGLIAIRDEAGTALFRETLSIFPDSTPSENRSIRLGQLSALEEANEIKLSDHLNSMTAAYLADPFPNWELVLSYVKNHTSEFNLQNA